MKTIDRTVEPTEEWAREQDSQDELVGFRERFHIDPSTIYLDGNSLGLLSIDAERAVQDVLEDWRRHAVRGWTRGRQPWFTLAEETAARMAPLIGAEPDEVILGNSTTVNLHQLLATLYDPASQRDAILIDRQAFPSDAYAVESHLRLRGKDPQRTLLRPAASSDGLSDEEQIAARFTPDVQMAILPVVVYTTGQWLDVRYLTRKAHESGILIGLDCSHSIGVLPHDLSQWGVDFAIWCTYKYLNGGPGATGGLYLNRRHFGKRTGLAGWFSSDKALQFDMPPALQPASGAGALQIGTPNILSLAAAAGALGVVLDAGIERIREKSVRLTDYLITLTDEFLGDLGFRLVTPRESSRRGGHVALRHPDAVRICRGLMDRGIVPDFRPPDIVRLAPSPLYTRHVDCWLAIRHLANLVAAGGHLQYDGAREIVS